MARYIKKNNQLLPISGAQFADTPIGTVIASFLAIAPAGYIKTDNTTYSMDDYPEFADMLPSASTGVITIDSTNRTFSIDLREVALKGIGLSSLTSTHYSSTGLTLGEFIEDRNRAHSHNISNVEFGEVDGTYSDRDNSYVFRGAKYTGSLWWKTPSGGVTTSSGSNTNEVKSVGVNYFVKAKQIGVPADIMAGIEENFATKEYAHPSYLDTFESLISGTGGNTSPEITATVVTPGLYAMSSYTYATGQGNSYCNIQINGKILFNATRYAAYEYGFCQATLYLHAGDTVTLASSAAPFNNSSYFFCKRIA